MSGSNNNGLTPAEEKSVIETYVLPVILKWGVDNVPEDKYLDVFSSLKSMTGVDYTPKEVNKMIDTVYKQLFVDDTGDLKVDQKTKQSEHIPKYKNNSESKEKFREMVRQYVRSQPNNLKLLTLNKIQKKTPFNLLDPNRKYKKDLSYGYADLLRFACQPVDNGEVARFVANSPGIQMEYSDEHKEFIPKRVEGSEKEFVERDNPFYNPIRYPIPDIEGNKRLEEVIIGSRKYLHQMKLQVDALRDNLRNGNLKYEEQKQRINAIVKIYIDIYRKQTNPVYLSQLVKGQERPISEYRKHHFKELLNQLITKKKLHPNTVGQKAPDTTGYTITGPELKSIKSILKKNE